MIVDLFALVFFVLWTAIVWRAAKRADTALRAACAFRADAFLSEVRRGLR